ncbi:histidine kinase/DNA gyrase B/HSP90-like ATPase [Thermosporothrix hazakensis]|jgi:signal transduction histidine kinase|uniref:Histidine kinase/DNA gyrase B/HSP90-like ATPase n=2 Tax=Thermosporothrix TaxID=768650 RepID=A0A326UBT4_THEHA|nr:response regulator [Thermosporothrix hazakensis]PZW32835.1 histidine kinase/DNA gyrase B/HSP90-like ATPase [Thermosporothrix hazakensis]BBH90816.1 hypothetical protein KTC_55670 [Thermosporothrix sp. COM3]GCE48866.1 hypothetical protein KTH_37350 [Thermosporothrix hazakensis]
MSGVRENIAAKGVLAYNSETNRLELDGYELQRGESIEIHVLGSWIPGQIALDSGGWYLFTLDHVGIRLHSGLPARFCDSRRSLVTKNDSLQPSFTPPPYVLIVDDDPGLLDALPRTVSLRIPGIRIDIASSSTEALRLIHDNRYDAIISDIKMPGMDGFELLEQARKVRPEVPVLLITGHGEHDLAIRALRGGAYDYIPKPVDRDTLIAALLRAIQACQLRRRVEEQQLALEIHARSLELQVQQRTHELFEANATKDKVISLVSSDLKVPLARLKEMTQLIRRKLSNADVAELVSRGFADIESHLERTEELVQELLNTSRIDAGKFIVHRVRQNLVELCRTFLEEFCTEQNACVTCQFLGMELEADVDADRIAQVLRTLLSNACKHASKEAPITITLQQSGDEAIISIRNVRNVEGPGSGLYVARKIIERHEGHLEIQSFPHDRCAFFLILPLPADVPMAQQQASPMLPRTLAVWTLSEQLHEEASGTKPSQPPV